MTNDVGAGDVNGDDCSKFTSNSSKNWNDKDVVQSIRDRFVTGDWSKAAARAKASEVGSSDHDAVYGDFEDVEMGEEDGAHSNSGGMQKENDALIEERRLKKLALRAKFDSQYPFAFSDNLCQNLLHSLLTDTNNKVYSHLFLSKYHNCINLHYHFYCIFSKEKYLREMSWQMIVVSHP